MLTDRERATLEYLASQWNASSFRVGQHIFHTANIRGRGSNLSSIGATVIGWLARKGFVERAPNMGFLRAWRITTAGRNALECAKPPVDKQARRARIAAALDDEI